MARETTKQNFDAVNPILVDINGLQQLCGSGRFTCEKIATAANAKIKIGRRTLYNNEKVRAYINNIAEFNEV